MKQIPDLDWHWRPKAGDCWVVCKTDHAEIGKQVQLMHISGNKIWALPGWVRMHMEFIPE